MNGIFLLNKPLHWTSHDLVMAVRKNLSIQRVGHAGTLDPMATGLMILLLGEATSRSNEFMGLDKAYRGSIRLGMGTDSWDMDGKILDTASGEIASLDPQHLKKIFLGFLGQQLMTPPTFSAIKKNGVRAHHLARKGESVRMEPRQIEITQFELEAYDAPEVYFRLECSKGTYVRAIAHELGKRLGACATLSSLVRTRIGPHRLEEAVSWQSLRSSQANPHENLSRV